jgi:hypothetical protein
MDGRIYGFGFTRWKGKKEVMPGEILLRATCLKPRKLVPAPLTAAMQIADTYGAK